jgi:hypothetical protein
MKPTAAPELEAGWSGNVLEWGHSVAMASSGLTRALNPINMPTDNSFPDGLKAQLKKEGKSGDVAGVTSNQITSPGAAGPLPARVYVPDGDAKKPVLSA